ncbi:MAG: ATP-binding protein [Myxococcota bacterium]|nr:ATP-binding protein [Myxococcota bacterium]
MWSWLSRIAEPVEDLRDPVDRHKSRLMSAILLLVVPVGIVSILLGSNSSDAELNPSWVYPVELFAMACMGLCFPWAKGVHYRRAAFIFVLLGMALVVVVILGIPERSAFNTSYLIIPLAISQIFFGSRMSVMIFALNVTIVLVLGSFVAGFEELLGPTVLSFQVLAGGCLVLGGFYRARLAQEKQSTLETQEAKFRALLKVGFDGIADIEDGVLVSATEGFAQAFGHPSEHMLGQPLVDFFPSDAAATLQSMETELAEQLVELRALRSDGREFPVEVVVQAQGTRQQTGLVLALRDITERREVFARMQITDRMAAMGTLAAGVAHEVNNPLTFVSGNLERAIEHVQNAEGISQERLLNWLVSAEEGALRVERIVGDLNTFARDPEEEGLQPLEVEKILNSSVAIAISAIKHRAQLVREHEPNVVVLADQTRLSQVLVNLLMNAVQAMPSDDPAVNEIALRSFEDDGEVLIEVADNGPGIPGDILPRIFEPFFTTKPVGVGTGLGLSICKNLVERMGGVMEVETSPAGTLFRLRLHAVEGWSGAVERTYAPMVDVARVESGKILVVDDEPEIGGLLSDILEGFDVTLELDGDGALSRLEEESFDAVLCDLMMPVMTGMELYHQCISVRPEMAGRFVFLTGGAFTNSAREFLEKEGPLCLTKPFRPNQVLSMLSRVMPRS